MKDTVPRATTWMNFEDITLSGINQIREKQTRHDFTYTRSLPTAVRFICTKSGGGARGLARRRGVTL